MFGREREARASWIDVLRAVELEGCRLGEEGLYCHSSEWVLLERVLEPKNGCSKVLTRDYCREVVGWSVNWIGLFVKEWRTLSTNGFRGWSGKATGKIGEEEEEIRVLISGTVGNFKSRGDKSWSQSIPFSSESSSSWFSKGSGWSTEM